MSEKSINQASGNRLSAEEIDTVLQMEKRLLASIKEQTGLEFRKIGGIDTTDAHVAARVLPVVRNLIPQTTGSVRGGLQFLFKTPAAAPYADDILQWLREEEDELSRSFLVQVLAGVANAENAARIWGAMKDLPPTSSDAMLLVKLAGCGATAEQVADRILLELSEVAQRVSQGERLNTFGLGPVNLYSKVGNPRVRRWFLQQTDSKDADLRRIAMRVARKRVKVPPSCHVAQELPSGEELFSTEVNARELGAQTAQLAARFRIQVPPVLMSVSASELLPTAGWLVCATVSNQRPVSLCYTFEDYDVVEMRLLRRTES